MLKRDEKTYSSLVQAVASLSGLFSSSECAYLDSRFVEKLFALTTGAEDLGRDDKSFDAKLGKDIGVGVKTFVADGGRNYKVEKIAEFTSLAGNGFFKVSDPKKLALRIASARNQRLLSNANEYGISISKCVYHCLIRCPGFALVHEEALDLIDTEELFPTTPRGARKASWEFSGTTLSFSDGKSFYTFSRAKNVLMKRFTFDFSSERIDTSISSDPFGMLNRLVGRTMRGESIRRVKNLKVGRSAELKPGKDFVVLPLYSTRNGEVAPKSGINQWNAGGRERKFGEAYIPVPRYIHVNFPRFFPARDKQFDLILPNSPQVLKAKICQQGGKALMTKNNVDLGNWIIGVLKPHSLQGGADGTVRVRGSGREPFTRNDLLRIGSDCVVVRRKVVDGRTTYFAEFGTVGQFEEFVLLER